VSVLIDTPIWSLALRRRPNAITSHQNVLKNEFAALIQEGRATLLGPVRQELLSGIKEEAQFNRIREYLQGFPDPTLQLEDFEHAAKCSNQCRARGVAHSPVDMLLCAVAIRRNWKLFTPDGDFKHYATVLPIHLHQARHV
jgi:predicted nucleic acid-binding protein